MWIFTNIRRARSPQGALLAGYPARLRQLIFWYDGLSDWQRVQYAGAACLFLLACGGYLLGLGSTMVLQRVQLEDAAVAAERLPTPSVPAPTSEALMVAAPTGTVPAEAPTQATPTVSVGPTTLPAFNAPVIAEPPAAPRSLPANVAPPAVAVPAAPARATPTLEKPRNLESSKPEPPAASVATSTTSGIGRTALPAPTAVRQLTPRGVAATVRPTPAP
ncbi:MAG: hypothetical protein ACR2IK_22640, partial [Chloroflexota bacterium]